MDFTPIEHDLTTQIHQWSTDILWIYDLSGVHVIGTNGGNQWVFTSFHKPSPILHAQPNILRQPGINGSQSLTSWNGLPSGNLLHSYWKQQIYSWFTY